MGCISSKIATRSRSFREELSQSLQRRVNGLPMLDDLLISKDAGDQFLTLVCTANTVAKKLQTGILPSESNTNADKLVENLNPEAINTLESMDGLEEQQQQKSPSSHRDGGHNDVAVTSKDSHKPSKEHTLASGGECLVLSNNIDVITKNASIGDAGALTRSRSYHTVEEYDTLVRASHRQYEAGMNVRDGAHSQQFGCLDTFKTNGFVGDDRLPQRSRSFHTLEECDVNRWSEVGRDARIGDPTIEVDEQHPESYRTASSECSLQPKHIDTVKKDDESPIKDQDICIEVQESYRNSFDFKSLDLKNTAISECSSSSSSTNIAKKVNFTAEKGFRRKLKGKELTALSVPKTTFDFPVIGSIGERLDLGGQVFSSRDYITPRFGSFKVPISANGNNARTVFDPAMVAAFEEAMKELTVEEECILKQIEDMDGDVDMVKEVEEESPNHMRDVVYGYLK